MRSLGRVRLLSIVVLGLTLVSFSQTAVAYVQAYFTTNGTSYSHVRTISPTVTFNASYSSPSPTTYYWDFGDGTTEATTSPIIYHSFPQSYDYIQFYNVTLTVYEGSASSSHSVLIQVMCSGYQPGTAECLS